mgnify:CR=1 FL=1
MFELTTTEGEKILVSQSEINLVVPKSGYLELYITDVPFPILVLCPYATMRDHLDVYYREITETTYEENQK